MTPRFWHGPRAVSSPEHAAAEVVLAAEPLHNSDEIHFKEMFPCGHVQP